MPEPVGPMSAVMNPRFSDDVDVLENRSARETQGELHRLHHRLGTVGVGIERLQGGVEIGPCLHRNRIVTSIANLSICHYQDRSEAK